LFASVSARSGAVSHGLEDAEVDQRVDLVRLVEHRIHAQLRTTLADVGRGVVAQHHDLLIGLAGTAGLQHAQAAALLEEQVDDRQFPRVTVVAQPATRIGLGFGVADRADEGQLLQRPDEVLANRWVVFDDVGFKSGVHPERQLLSISAAGGLKMSDLSGGRRQLSESTKGEPA